MTDQVLQLVSKETDLLSDWMSTFNDTKKLKTYDRIVNQTCGMQKFCFTLTRVPSK